MKIGTRKIGPGEPPFIIAEISGNHCGDYQKCVLLMGIAIGCGADAVKLQCYSPDSITLDCDKPDFIIKDGPWQGRKLHELYQKAHTPIEWFAPLFGIAKQYGVTLFASVFDKASVDLLEKLDCPAYKIASMEIVDTPLIEYAAKTGKPVILSTGMASRSEVHEAIAACAATSYATLHCISGYPTPIEESNLQDMGDYAKVHGISDHTMGWEIPVAAAARGAQIIEKHICVSRSDPTEDAAFSLEPEEFKQMCKAVRSVWKATQASHAQSEASSFQLRRSLYVTQDMKVGDLFSTSNVRSIRPGYGMQPSMLPKVLGRVAAQDIERGTALEESHIA